MINENASFVRKYAHIGSYSDITLPDTDMINIWSNGDTALPGANIEGCVNVSLDVEDHYSVATSEQSFEALWTFWESPETEPLSADFKWGRAVRFGDNQPIAGATVIGQRVDLDGHPLPDSPIVNAVTGQYGWFGPLPISEDESWLWTLDEGNDQPVRHYFGERAQAPLQMRLRGIPSDGLAGTIISSLNISEASTMTLITFSSSQTMIANRDLAHFKRSRAAHWRACKSRRQHHRNVSL